MILKFTLQALDIRAIAKRIWHHYRHCALVSGCHHMGRVTSPGPTSTGGTTGLPVTAVNYCMVAKSTQTQDLEVWSGYLWWPGHQGGEVELTGLLKAEVTSVCVSGGRGWCGPGTSDPLFRYVFISWLTERMPTPHMEFCLHLIYGSQLFQPLQLPAADHMDLSENEKEGGVGGCGGVEENERRERLGGNMKFKNNWTEKRKEKLERVRQRGWDE